MFGKFSVVTTKNAGTDIVFSRHGVESSPNGSDLSQMSWPGCCSLEDLNTSAKSMVKSTFVKNDVRINNLTGFSTQNSSQKKANISAISGIQSKSKSNSAVRS